MRSSLIVTGREMIKALLAAAFVLVSATAAAVPPTADPFAWLGEPHGEKAVAWARERSEAAMKELAAIPQHQAVVHELRDSLKTAALPTRYFLLGHKMARFIRDSAHPSGLLQVATRGPRGLPAPS